MSKEFISDAFILNLAGKDFAKPEGHVFAHNVNYPLYKELWANGKGPESYFLPTYKQDPKNPGKYINKKD
jgi:coproporphyrinogen III oxidase-like Fe-S oxidoreductase